MDFKIVNTDALEWCQGHIGSIPAIVTSIPDMSEVNMEETEYIPFLRKSAHHILNCITDTGYAIFIQTDRKKRGLIDKSYHISDEAIRLGFRMMFHKISLIRDVDVKDLYKPTYTHVLCYSKEGKPGRSTSDVYDRGSVLYKNGAGYETIKRSLEFLQTQHIHTVVDPFVGQGTVLKVAIECGFTSGIGIDIDAKQCEISRNHIHTEIIS